jgi:hypothetical protein
MVADNRKLFDAFNPRSDRAAINTADARSWPVSWISPVSGPIVIAERKWAELVKAQHILDRSLIERSDSPGQKNLRGPPLPSTRHAQQREQAHSPAAEGAPR